MACLTFYRTDSVAGVEVVKCLGGSAYEQTHFAVWPEERVLCVHFLSPGCH